MVKEKVQSSQNAKKKTVVVAGDVVIDHLIYKGARSRPHSRLKRGTTMQTERGGADLLLRILQRLGGVVDEKFDAELGTVPRSDSNLSESYSLLTPCPAVYPRTGEVWRVTETLGYGATADEVAKYDAAPLRGTEPASVVVLDDAALGFRDGGYASNAAWPLELDKDGSRTTEWVVLKMSAPVCQGDLWLRVCEKFRDRLVVVVSASELREEEVGIAEGLSWEHTAQDLLQELTLNNSISCLTRCQHLVVALGTDGALWCSRESDGSVRYRLVYDPGGFEGAWAQGVQGRVWGEMSCLVAAIVAELVKSGDSLPDLGTASMRGLGAMRQLILAGHGEVDAVDADGKAITAGFPFDVVMPCLVAAPNEYRIAEVPVAVAEVGKSKEWTIISGYQAQASQCPVYGLGRRVALFGSKALVDALPHAVFGGLTVVDRTEIESLRGLERLIRTYESVVRKPKPLSLAVFGAPGSGKSFSVKQVAAKALDKKDSKELPILEFNLSQFSDPRDLIGAFHQVRDKVLEGTTPIVFWDEFDSREYMWLQYFLAPMNDGKFQEGQVTHPIGKCVFVFAGGTSNNFANFAPPEKVVAKGAGAARPATAGTSAGGSTAFEKFRLAKGPDFVSRLNGYMDIAGPNRRQVYDAAAGSWVEDRDPADLCFPVRRALLLRAKAGLVGAARDEEMDVDSGLLTALLEVDRYKHGARSLEAIVGLVRSTGLSGLRRSGLPPQDQLALHVDYDEFMDLVERDRPFQMNSEVLAPYVHMFYRELAHSEGWTDVKFDMPWDELPEDMKAENVAAAARIPRVLALVGLAVVDKDHPLEMSESKVKSIIEDSLELLAEGEHDGWMEQKYRTGWLYSFERDDGAKKHPALVQYPLLGTKDKMKDRNSVRCYPDIVKKAGFKIVAAGSIARPGYRTGRC